MKFHLVMSCSKREHLGSRDCVRRHPETCRNNVLNAINHRWKRTTHTCWEAYPGVRVSSRTLQEPGLHVPLWWLSSWSHEAQNLCYSGQGKVDLCFSEMWSHPQFRDCKNSEPTCVLPSFKYRPSLPEDAFLDSPNQSVPSIPVPPFCCLACWVWSLASLDVNGASTVPLVNPCARGSLL